MRCIKFFAVVLSAVVAAAACSNSGSSAGASGGASGSGASASGGADSGATGGSSGSGGSSGGSAGAGASAGAAGTGGGSAEAGSTGGAGGSGGGSSLLYGCTVGATNQPSCSTPSGWTLVDAQGFESGAFNAHETAYGAGNSETIDQANAHTGTHSLDTYVTHSYGGLGMVLSGSAINSRTVYVSFWQYAQQANPGYGLQYTDWYMVVRDDRPYTETNPNREVSNGCLGGCQSAATSFYNQGAGYPNWALYTGETTLNEGRWVQHEFLIKENDPGATNGVFKEWLNGKLLQDVDNTQVSSRCPSAGCGDFVGTLDMSTANLWIGGDWGAIYATTPGGSPKNQNMAACSGGYASTGVAATAQQLCPPNGMIPDWHDYIDDVIVLKQ